VLVTQNLHSSTVSQSISQLIVAFIMHHTLQYGPEPLDCFGRHVGYLWQLLQDKQTEKYNDEGYSSLKNIVFIHPKVKWHNIIGLLYSVHL